MVLMMKIPLSFSRSSRDPIVFINSGYIAESDEYRNKHIPLNRRTNGESSPLTSTEYSEAATVNQLGVSKFGEAYWGSPLG